MLVALLVVVQYELQLAPALAQNPRVLLEVFASMYFWNAAVILVAFLLIAIVQLAVPPGHTRFAILTVGVLAFVSLWAQWFAVVESAHTIVVEYGLTTARGQLFDGIWTNTTYLLLAVWCYEIADRARRSTAVLRENEIARQSAERWLLDMRLRRLQARLDPRVLFDTLDEIGRLYRSQPAAAEDLLDRLIDYLRSALPQLRQRESTVQREVDLALAYAQILRGLGGATLAIEAHVERDAARARFPPMVVQPICDALGRQALLASNEARLTIHATRDDDYLRVVMTGAPVTSLPDARRIDATRRTLLAMFAPQARLEATLAGDAATVSAEVPYVTAPRVDR
jgi:sensor histidine kinase YesM